METHAILTAIGADRPGLVEEVSQFIFERGGNIADSRMVNLRGQFAIMVLLGGDEKTLGRIRSDVWQLQQSSGLHADLRPASAVGSVSSADALAYRLTATAIDQPGLVHRISHLLKALGVNIESLETRLTAAPYTGAPMFEMELVLSVSRKIPIGDLRGKLGGLCDELNVDWQLATV